MNDMTTAAAPAVLLPEAEVASRVQALAEAIAPHVDDETVAICLLTGGLWFAADLTRALARLGHHVAFDAVPAQHSKLGRIQDRRTPGQQEEAIVAAVGSSGSTASRARSFGTHQSLLTGASRHLSRICIRYWRARARAGIGNLTALGAVRCSQHADTLPVPRRRT